MSIGRKFKRSKEKRASKQTKKDVSEKMMMFDSLPDECLACLAPFDKKDKEMVTSWNVVVREVEGTVRLYCPECWQRAKDAIKNVYGGADE